MARASAKDAKALAALQAAFDAEMAGVVLYTELGFRVFGPQMIGIVAHLRGQAAESLTHAEAAGDRMTSLGGVPVVKSHAFEGPVPTTLEGILGVSLAHERRAVEAYRAVMKAAGGNIPLEEYARTMVATETDHSVSLEKMLRPMG